MEIQAYLAPLKKWWWLLIVATGIAALTSFYTVQQQPARYRARTTLMIGRTIADPNPSNSQLSVGQQLAQAYADIAQREPVREATQEALNMSWLPQYEARALPQRNLIEISVIDTDPERARLVAQEIADQLVRLSPGQPDPETQERQAFIAEQLDGLQTQIRETEEEITARQAELGELFSAGDIEAARTEIAALQAKLGSLQTNYAQLLANTRENAINTLVVFEPASVSPRPVGPNALMTVVAASAIAFALATGTAFLLELLDDTIKSPDDVKQVADLATLGTIGRIEDENGDLVTIAEPRSPHAEAFRALRLAVRFSAINPRNRRFLLTSPNAADGKSLVAANLAVVMAQAGQKVLLVDCDLRRPVQHKLFSESNTSGITDLVLELTENGGHVERTVERALAEKQVKKTSVNGLSLLTSGSLPPYPSELLGSVQMEQVLCALSDRFDVLIVDSPPCLAVTDPVVLSTQVDTTLLIANAGRTRRSDLETAISRLGSVDAHIAGVVLNRISQRAYSYYTNKYVEESQGDEPESTRIPDGSRRRVRWSLRLRRSD